MARETNNPYLTSARLIYNRLAWDIRPAAHISRYALNRLKDINKGDKAVILCNGPSLLKVDLNLLSGVYTFGLNKINLLFDNSSFRPSCVVSVNKYVIAQNREFYNNTDIPLFLDSVAYAKGYVRQRNNVTYLHSGGEKFAKNCSVSISQGSTVTYVALQLAFHMGFTEVALVGCDHNFSSKGAANKTVIAAESDRDHFDARYFSGGVPWQLPDLVGSEISYLKAREEFSAAGRRVVNATVGGELNVFHRCELEDFVAKA